MTEDEVIEEILRKDTSGYLQVLLESSLQQIQSTRSSREAMAVVNKTFEDIQRVENISVYEKNQLQSYMGQKSSQLHGIQTEITTANKLNEISKEGIRLETDDNYYEIEVFKSHSHRYKIVGRIDRIERNDINGDVTLIEIKNRMHRLFYKVKEYEYIQVQIYLFLTGLHRAKLVEQWNDEMHSSDISRNQSFIDHVILPELLEFVRRVDSVLSSSSARIAYLEEKMLKEATELSKSFESST